MNIESLPNSTVLFLVVQQTISNSAKSNARSSISGAKANIRGRIDFGSMSDEMSGFQIMTSKNRVISLSDKQN